MDINPIEIIKNNRITLEDDYWGNVISSIHLDENQFTEQSIQGLQNFSHLEVIFYMNRVDPTKISLDVRHPRNQKDWPKVGIFSQRAKARPNQLGVSRCRIIKIENLTITVEALDAVNDTPVLDIKPYMKEFGPIGEVEQPLWATELMENYYKSRLIHEQS